jgi:hypothetical protein
VLEANPTAIRMFRRFKPYHEIEDVIERRLAIVTLHSEGWNVKSIAIYLKTSRPTVYRTLNQWIAENVYSLEYKPCGAKSKVDLWAMNEIENCRRTRSSGSSASPPLWRSWASTSAPVPAGASSLSTASSTASKNRSGVPRRRRRCRSSPVEGMRFGA